MPIKKASGKLCSLYVITYFCTLQIIIRFLLSIREFVLSKPDATLKRGATPADTSSSSSVSNLFHRPDIFSPVFLNFSFSYVQNAIIKQKPNISKHNNVDGTHSKVPSIKVAH